MLARYVLPLAGNVGIPVRKLAGPHQNDQICETVGSGFPFVCILLAVIVPATAVGWFAAWFTEQISEMQLARDASTSNGWTEDVLMFPSIAED
jgi:hypothetical protein